MTNVLHDQIVITASLSNITRRVQNVKRTKVQMKSLFPGYEPQNMYVGFVQYKGYKCIVRGFAADGNTPLMWYMGEE